MPYPPIPVRFPTSPPSSRHLLTINEFPCNISVDPFPCLLSAESPQSRCSKLGKSWFPSSRIRAADEFELPVFFTELLSPYLRIRMLIRDSHPHSLRAQTQAHHLRNEPLISQPSMKPASEADGGVQLPNRSLYETWGTNELYDQT